MRKSNIFNVFKAREIIGIFLLAFLLTSCMKSIVNILNDFFDDESVVTIRIPDVENGNVNSIVIIDEGREFELFSELKEANENDGNEWIYSEGEKGVSWTKLSADKPGAQISISTKLKSNAYVAFLSNCWAGTVIVETDEKTTEINCHTDQSSSEIIRFHPFEDSVSFLVGRFLIYSTFLILFF